MASVPASAPDISGDDTTTENEQVLNPKPAEPSEPQPPTAMASSADSSKGPEQAASAATGPAREEESLASSSAAAAAERISSAAAAAERISSAAEAAERPVEARVQGSSWRPAHRAYRPMPAAPSGTVVPEVRSIDEILIARPLTEDQKRMQEEQAREKARKEQAFATLRPPAYAGGGQPLTGQWTGRQSLQDAAEQEAQLLCTPAPAGAVPAQRLIGGGVADMAASIAEDQANWFAKDREEDAARTLREAERERQQLEWERQEAEEGAAALAEWTAKIDRCRVLAAGNTQPEDIAEDDRDLVQRIRSQQSIPAARGRATGKGKGKGKGKQSAVPAPDPKAAWPPPLTPEREAQLAAEAAAKAQKERAATG